MNIYPPLLFNRIILKEISKDFMMMKVVIKRSFLNINHYKTIFGGSIFSACDPFFPIMYYHIFARKKHKLIVWIKSAEISYLKPAESSLELTFNINQEEINHAKKELGKSGKFENWHTVEAKNKNGVICVKAKIQIYLRNLNN